MQGIYKITNTVNGKCYIGRTSNFERRWYLHRWKLNSNKCENQHLQNAWNKYSENAFEFSILELCDFKISGEREKYWIEKYSKSCELYNMTIGGEGNSFPGELNPMYGKHHTDAVKSQISNKKIQYYKEHQNPMFNRKHTEDTKRKISVKNKGRVQSDAEKLKRTNTMRKLYRTDEQFKNKMLDVAKQNGIKNRKYTDAFVEMLRTEYENTDTSITKLAKKYSIPRSSCENIIEGYGRFKKD